MDASCTIQGSIHSFFLVHNMCPELWVHINFGGVFDYYLPESGIMLHLASGSLKNSDFLQKNPHWHGDTKGFYPDYWCTDSSLLPTLVAITKDKKLKKSLRGLHKHLL